MAQASSSTHAGPSQRNDLVRLGQDTYNSLIWSGAVGNPTADNEVVTAFLPIYPTVQQAQRFGSRETNVIVVSTYWLLQFIYRLI